DVHGTDKSLPPAWWLSTTKTVSNRNIVLPIYFLLKAFILSRVDEADMWCAGSDNRRATNKAWTCS
ncbi:MAG: hypothetical protein ABJZ69_00435, partial [Hyphomicrobiales bacterium]